MWRQACRVQVQRRCYYTGWFYCSDCHSGATAIIPATVLHAWEFSRQPVCNMAKEFLQSIHEQALLKVPQGLLTRP